VHRFFRVLKIVVVVLVVLWFTGAVNRFLGQVAQTYWWMRP